MAQGLPLKAIQGSLTGDPLPIKEGGGKKTHVFLPCLWYGRDQGKRFQENLMRERSDSDRVCLTILCISSEVKGGNAYGERKKTGNPSLCSTGTAHSKGHHENSYSAPEVKKTRQCSIGSVRIARMLAGKKKIAT